MSARPVSAAPARAAAHTAADARSPRTRRIGGGLLLALSAALALTSAAVAGKTGGGAGLQQHAARHETLHHTPRHKLPIRQEAGEASSSPATCVTDSSKNPISQLWPNDISGNLNGTTMIVPIPLAEARRAIPQEYGILENAWREWLPDFPAGMYPMMAVAVHDHDLRFPAFNVTTPDFSRSALEFPFVDVLNDGYSSFRWAANMLITAGSPAVAGSEAFGITVYPAAFDPPCNAYRGSEREPGLATFRAWSASTVEAPSTSSKAGKCTGGAGDDHSQPWKNAERSLYFETRPTLEADDMPYPLRFLVNITNQPVFASPSICDNYKRLFNTTLTTDLANAPIAVKGDVMGNFEPFFSQPTAGEEAQSPLLHHQRWPGVYGWRLSTAFLEPPVPTTCDKLKEYAGTGPGDSAQP
ncbi:hypothetical protein MN608_06496 [Microdochium nivale]|nr:hypothetical protein MN608_06496 [Microdochium nivale]